MITLLLLLFTVPPFLVGSHRQLALENLALQQQLAVYKRTVSRPPLRRTDRLFWVALARVWADWRAAPLDRPPPHPPAVAAASLPPVLDQALRPAHRRPPACQRRDQSPGRANGHGESALGCATYSCRAPQARHRRVRANRVSADAEAAHTAIPDLADVPRQPCPRFRPPRLLHGSHHRPTRPLRSRRARSSSSTGRPFQRDRASHRPLGRPADRECLPRRLRTILSPPRPRPGLRRAVSAPREGPADGGSPHGPAQPMAESLRGAPHRFDPTGGSESRSRPR